MSFSNFEGETFNLGKLEVREKKSQISINVQNLSKCFFLFKTPRNYLKYLIISTFRNTMGLSPILNLPQFWALKDVSFDIKKGEVVGIIGRNGSGKSTLLQIICGTSTQTIGDVHTKGRVVGLLELGSGFNPDFTGRENIYMNAMVLGLSKNEIDEKFEEIVNFADIGKYLDQPTKTYSSGMLARLSFSVAIQVDPDILIVDEALSVGDMAFQEKSFTRMKQIRERGTSILFVSHSISAVRNFCDRAIWLEYGKIREIGERLAVCEKYQNEMEKEISQEFSKSKNLEEINKSAHHLKSNPNPTIKITSVVSDKEIYRMGEDIKIEIGLQFKEHVPPYGVGIVICDLKGAVVSILNTIRDDIFFRERKKNIILLVNDNHFAPGKYFITISICDENGMFSFDKLDSCLMFEIQMERSSGGLAKVDGVLRCDHLWL